MATVGYIRTGPEGVATPVHSRDQDFRVEAKGLEPSNLLTARWLNTVAARVRSSRVVAFWLVQTAVQRADCNGVQLRATPRDGFVGSNVGFSSDEDKGGRLCWTVGSAHVHHFNAKRP